MRSSVTVAATFSLLLGVVAFVGWCVGPDLSRVAAVEQVEQVEQEK
jgi:hypothetical protein